MIHLEPTAIEGRGIRLEPLTFDHHDGLATAAADGKLWQLWFTSVPKPEETRAYIASALSGLEDGHMLPWAVRGTFSKVLNVHAGTYQYHITEDPGETRNVYDEGNERTQELLALLATFMEVEVAESDSVHID